MCDPLTFQKAPAVAQMNNTLSPRGGMPLSDAEMYGVNKGRTQAAEQRLRPDVTARVKEKFRAIAPQDLAVVDSRAAGMSDNRKVEMYPPSERDNPLPGRATVEVFDPSFQGDDLDNVIAADFIHSLGKTDPTLKHYRDAFSKSLTPEQKAIDRRAYERAVAGEFGDPEQRPFDQWYEIHRLDQYLGAPYLPEGSAHREEWMRGMTPEQLEMLDAMQRYMKTGQ